MSAGVWGGCPAGHGPGRGWGDERNELGAEKANPASPPSPPPRGLGGAEGRRDEKMGHLVKTPRCSTHLHDKR